MNELELVSRIMQILTGILAIFIAIYVFMYNRNKDREAVREKIWAAQQQLNFLKISSLDVMKCSDLVMEGVIDHNTSDYDLQRAIYVTFIQINRIHLLWSGWNSKLYSRRFLDREAQPTLRLIIGNRTMFDYCLSRGYSKEFRDYMSLEADFVSDNMSKPMSMKNFIQTLRESKV